MFSIFKKKIVVPHIRLSGIIGNVGKFKQGIEKFSNIFASKDGPKFEQLKIDPRI